MAEFVSDDDYNPIVDFVGKYENLEADFRRACEQAHLGPIELPHLNRSTNGDYRKHFSPETRDIVAGWAARDIEMFDYDF